MWLNILLAAALGSVATLALSPVRSGTRSERRVAERVSKSAPVADPEFSIASVLSLPERSFDEKNIAILNLQCAAGLLGSDTLDADVLLATLDEWAARVAFDTERHLYQFRDNPAEFENSEEFYRMQMMTTVIQQDFNVRYNPERARDPDFRDSRDLFIHGLLGEKRTGTCASMPVLSVALGRRLGYPLKLAQARSHLYVRWELGAGKHLNFDATSLGVTTFPDEYYANWPEPLSKAELDTGAFLRALTPREEAGVFMQMRGHCLHDNGRVGEAQVAYAIAHQLFPTHPFTLPFLAETVQASLDRSPMFARRRNLFPPQRGPTMDESMRMAEELNARNLEHLERLWRHDPSTNRSWPLASPSPIGGVP